MHTHHLADPTPRSGVSSRDQTDRLPLEMLRQAINPAKWVMEIAAVETVTRRRYRPEAGHFSHRPSQ